MTQCPQLLHDEHLDNDDNDIIHDDHLDSDIDMIHDQPTLSSLLLQRDERERLGIPLCSAQVLTVGSSGTTTATVLDLSEHPWTNIYNDWSVDDQ